MSWAFTQNVSDHLAKMLAPYRHAPASNPIMSVPATPPDIARAGFFRQLVGALPPRSRGARQIDLDAARGMAILLVVVGHVVAGAVPQGNDWYFVLKVLVYRFHMPLFMTLAGTSFALALPAFRDWGSIATYGRDKLARLIVPYLFFGLLILIGKSIAADFMQVDNRPTGSIDDVVALIQHPSSSAAGFLWFIYVLGLYFLTIPALLQLTGRRPIYLFITALAAQTVAWPTAFLCKEYFEYLPFFSGGMLLWLYRDRWAALSESAMISAALVFAAILALTIPLALPKWVVGAFSVPAILGLAQWIRPTFQRGLGWLGQLSMSIYLMNTLAIGIVKATMLKIVPWDGMNFLIYFPILTVAGLALPISVKRLTARRFPRVDRYL